MWKRMLCKSWIRRFYRFHVYEGGVVELCCFISTQGSEGMPLACRYAPAVYHLVVLPFRTSLSQQEETANWKVLAKELRSTVGFVLESGGSPWPSPYLCTLWNCDEGQLYRL